MRKRKVGRKRKVMVLGIRKMVVGRRRMVEIIKGVDEMEGDNESKGDGEEKKASINKIEQLFLDISLRMFMFPNSLVMRTEMSTL